MSLNSEAVRLLADKGLTAHEIADVMAACEKKKDNTAAERQARYRERQKDAKSRRDSNGVTPPIDNNHTPRVISSDEETTPAPKRGAFPMPDWCEDDAVWRDFLANRKRKRLPNTATAYKGFLDDIERISDQEWPPWRLLKHATVKGWGGIYDPRNDRGMGNGKANNRPGGTAIAAERALAIIGSRSH